MARRQSAEDAQQAELMQTLRLAAQHIWIAGISALAKTQEEGAKVYGALKKEGGRSTRSAREGIAHLTGNVGRAATQATRGAGMAMDRLDRLFDQRISRALSQLGMPSAEELRSIMDRLDALESGGRSRRTAASSRARTGAASAKRAHKTSGAAKRAVPRKRSSRTRAGG